MFRLIVALLSLSSTACAGKLQPLPASAHGPGVPGANAPPAFKLEGFKTSDGLWRSAYVFVPKNHTADAEPLPVIFAMHGGKGNSGVNMIRRFMQQTKSRPAIYVFPNGVNASRRIPGWTAHGRDGDPLRDVKFLSELAGQVQREHNGAAERTYATGFSNGGNATWYLSCFATDVFQATAVVGKPLPKLMMPHCPTEGKRVPMLYIHGDQDPNGLQENEHNHSMTDGRDKWSKHMDCKGKLSTSTSGIETRFTFKGCKAPYEMVELAGVEHEWTSNVTDSVLDWFDVARR